MSKCKYCGKSLANNDAAVQHAGECEIMNGDMGTVLCLLDNILAEPTRSIINRLETERQGTEG